MESFNDSQTILVNEEKMILIYQILTGCILYFLTIWTILGNLFILIAITTNKQLKQNGTSNILIGNLAFSDLLLGLTVLPFSATFGTFKIWTFGQLICDIWLSIDVLCCTASIWGLIMIALDRYIATNHPIKYRLQKKNIKIGLAYCSISWLISILISLGPLALYSTENSLNENLTIVKKTWQTGFKKINGTNDYTCVLFHKPSFVVSSSIVSFYLPLILMIILYSKVFFKIRNQNHFRAPKPSLRMSIRKKADIVTQTVPLNELVVSKSELNNSISSHLNLKLKRGDLKASFNENKSCKQNLHHENKITKTLAIIMTSFLSCWMPFFVIYIIRAFLDDPEVISSYFMDLFIWLGYFNSCLDPILYLILNEHFRETFINLITCKWSNLLNDKAALKYRK